MYRTSVRYKHERVWERKGSGHQVEGAQTHGKKVRKTLLKARSGPSRRAEGRHRRRGEGKFEGRGAGRRRGEARLRRKAFFCLVLQKGRFEGGQIQRGEERSSGIAGKGSWSERARVVERTGGREPAGRARRNLACFFDFFVFLAQKLSFPAPYTQVYKRTIRLSVLA